MLLLEKISLLILGREIDLKEVMILVVNIAMLEKVNFFIKEEAVEKDQHLKLRIPSLKSDLTQDNKKILRVD